MTQDGEIASLAANLAELAIRNTAGLVSSRIQAIRARKLDQEALNELVELVNELIAEKGQLIAIAQGFESQLSVRRISSDDIDYITERLIPTVESFARQLPGGEGSAFLDLVEPLKSLVSVETLTIMQLLGFNFRDAVGDPLTQLLRQFILSKAPMGTTPAVELQVSANRLNEALLALAQDAEGAERLDEIVERLRQS